VKGLCFTFFYSEYHISPYFSGTTSPSYARKPFSKIFGAEAPNGTTNPPSAGT
jgi:hypothetical protein